MLIPKFRTEESWDGLGDVDIWFMDNTSEELQKCISKELKKMIPKLHVHERSVYHVEQLVDYILIDMRKKNNLRKNMKTNQWVLAKEGRIRTKA